MKITTLALVLGWAAFLHGNLGLSQDPQGERGKPALSARIAVDEHEHSFTVRFFLKNEGKADERVVYGRGGSGLQVVPMFHLGSITISPPTYLLPPRRSMASNTRPIPAGKEILYGTFTMGYPLVRKAGEEKLTASIYFRELKTTIRTEAQMLKIPAMKKPK